MKGVFDKVASRKECFLKGNVAQFTFNTGANEKMISTTWKIQIHIKFKSMSLICIVSFIHQNEKNAFGGLQI